MKWDDDIIETYLSGELDEAQAREFARLLAERPAEAARVEELRRGREAVRMAAPEVPTQRMWKSIRARLAAGEGLEAVRENGFWERLLKLVSTPAPALRWSFSGAAVIMIAVGLRMNWPAQPAQPAQLVQPVAMEKVVARLSKFKAPSAARIEPAVMAAQAKSPKGPTEVEQALADQDVNQAMNAMLVEKGHMGNRSYLEAPLPATTVGLSGASATQSRGMEASRMYPGVLIMPMQSVGPNGLKVQAAGTQQYFANHRIAVYSNGVVTRMTGLHSEGDVLQLDLSSGQASFGPGTHFVRLTFDVGEIAVKIIGSDGAEIKDNEFNASRGADYFATSGELRLK